MKLIAPSLLAVVLQALLPRTASAADTSMEAVNYANTKGRTVDVVEEGADPTGRVPSASAIQRTIAAACKTSASRIVTMPPGAVFVIERKITVPERCTGLKITGQQWTMVADKSDVDNPVFLSVGPNTDDIEIDGGTFDGKWVSPQNKAPLVVVEAPMRGLRLAKDIFENDSYGFAGLAFYSADSGYQVSSLTGHLAAPVAGDIDKRVVLQMPIPVGLHVGAYINRSSYMDDLYVTSIDRSTGVIGINKVITDSSAAGSLITFTPAASLANEVTRTGDPTLVLDTVVGIRAGQTAWSPSECLPVNDRIKAIDDSTVTLEKPPLCALQKGSPIAFASGVANVTLDQLVFRNLGQSQRYANSASYHSFGDRLAGNKLTFQCLTKGCSKGRIGLIRGDISPPGAQNGLPANDEIINREVNNPDQGLYTVTLKKPLTGYAAAASYSWRTSASAGKGYGWFTGYGAWFSNRTWRENDSVFQNLWSNAVFIGGLSDVMFVNDKCYLDFAQTKSIETDGSGCKGIGSSDHITEVNLFEERASGGGYGLGHVHDFRFLGGTYEDNIGDGIIICGVRNVTFEGGLITRNNNQASSQQAVRYSFSGVIGNGIDLEGGCGFSTGGSSTGISIDNVKAYDDQSTHTQYYGVGKGNSQSNMKQPVSVIIGGGVRGGGNIAGLISPLLHPTYSRESK